jgi:hypothetical protein
MPTRPTRTRSDLACCSTSVSYSRDDGCTVSSWAGRTLRASKITRLPSLDHRSLSRYISARVCPSRVFTLPSSEMMCAQRSMRISGAPFIVSRLQDAGQYHVSNSHRLTYVSSCPKWTASAADKARSSPLGSARVNVRTMNLFLLLKASS